MIRYMLQRNINFEYDKKKKCFKPFRNHKDTKRKQLYKYSEISGWINRQKLKPI